MRDQYGYEASLAKCLPDDALPVREPLPQDPEIGPVVSRFCEVVRDRLRPAQE